MVSSSKSLQKQTPKVDCRKVIPKQRKCLAKSNQDMIEKDSKKCALQPP
jgi:hypothetical protein